jgi:hypothetical protein
MYSSKEILIQSTSPSHSLHAIVKHLPKQSMWKSTWSNGMFSRKARMFEKLPNLTAVSLTFNHSPNTTTQQRTAYDSMWW